MSGNFKGSPDGMIPLELVIYNPVKKSRHLAPCFVPDDILDMDEQTMKKAYGDHLINALYELVQHNAFRKGIAKPKLVLTGDENE